MLAFQHTLDNSRAARGEACGLAGFVEGFPWCGMQGPKAPCNARSATATSRLVRPACRSCRGICRQISIDRTTRTSASPAASGVKAARLSPVVLCPRNTCSGRLRRIRFPAKVVRRPCLETPGHFSGHSLTGPNQSGPGPTQKRGSCAVGATCLHGLAGWAVAWADGTALNQVRSACSEPVVRNAVWVPGHRRRPGGCMKAFPSPLVTQEIRVFSNFYAGRMPATPNQSRGIPIWPRTLETLSGRIRAETAAAEPAI